MKKICLKCNTVYDEGKFCRKCGGKLAEIKVVEEEEKAEEPLKAEPAPKAEEPLKAEPAPKAEEPPKAEPAPKAEEPPKAEPAPKAEEPPKAEPAPKAEEPPKAEPAPKAEEPQEEDILSKYSYPEGSNSYYGDKYYFDFEKSFENRVKYYFIAYGVVLLGAWAGLSASGYMNIFSFIFMALVCLSIVRFVIRLTYKTETRKYTNVKYYLPANISNMEEFRQLLEERIKARMDMSLSSVNKGTRSNPNFKPVIVKDSIEYRIDLFPQERYFKVLAEKIDIYHFYRLAVVGIPSVVYLIQSELSKFDKDIKSKSHSFASPSKLYDFNKTKTIAIATALSFVLSFAICLPCGAVLGEIVNLVAEDMGIDVGSSDNKYVKLVKNAKGPDGYGDITYGKAFSSFFGSPKWKYFEADNGKDIVEFNGDFTIDGEKAHACIQYELDIDNGSFEVSYFGIDDENATLLEYAIVVAKAFGGNADDFTGNSSSNSSNNSGSGNGGGSKSSLEDKISITNENVYCEWGNWYYEATVVNNNSEKVIVCYNIYGFNSNGTQVGEALVFKDILPNTSANVSAIFFDASDNIATYRIEDFGVSKG